MNEHLIFHFQIYPPKPHCFHFRFPIFFTTNFFDFSKMGKKGGKKKRKLSKDEEATKLVGTVHEMLSVP